MLETLKEMQAKREWAYLEHVLRIPEGNPHRELMIMSEKIAMRKKEDEEKSYSRKSERESGEEV